MDPEETGVGPRSPVLLPARQAQAAPGRVVRALQGPGSGQGGCWEEAVARRAQPRTDAPLLQRFLFTFYGMVLQAEEESTRVRTHLQSLLETSHQWPKQREVRA